MNLPIKKETTLLDAFRIQEDVPWWIQYQDFQNLTLVQKLTQIVADYSIKLFARILGVKVADRNLGSLTKRYDEYADASAQNPNNQHNKKVILVIQSQRNIPTEPQNFKKLEEQSGCKVVFRKIDTIKEASESMTTLKKNGCQIDALWIRAHGISTAITFDGLYVTDQLNIAPLDDLNNFHSEKINSFCETINQNLEIKAPIVLESCFTGQPMPAKQENIATYISRVAQRKVFAPKREALCIDDGVSYSEENGFNVVIKSFQPDRYFTPGSYIAKLSAVWLAFRGYKEDITQIIT